MSNLIDVESSESSSSSSSSTGSGDQSQYTRYCFTINNPFGDDKHDDIRRGSPPELAEVFRVRIKTPPTITYMLWCLEKGEGGTPHYQGYLEFDKKTRFGAIKNKYKPMGAFITVAMGSADDNLAYIGHTGKHANKPGLIDGPWTYGEPKKSGQGKRTDLADLAVAIKSGASEKELALNHTSSMLRYYNNAIKISKLLSTKKRQWMTELHILTGVAGAGKSHIAATEAAKYIAENGLDEEPYYLMVPKSTTEKLWWEGYNGQSCIIINDFYGSIDINYFKDLIDKYPKKVDIKNGSSEFLGKIVWVTSNKSWRNWWPESAFYVENVNAIERRITSVRTFDTPYVAPTDPTDAIMLGEAQAEQDALSLLCFEDMPEPVQRHNACLNWDFADVIN